MHEGVNGDEGSVDSEALRPPVCEHCGGELEKSYQFCPNCGLPQQTNNDYEQAVRAQIGRDIAEEYQQVRLWRRHGFRLLVLGILLLPIPDIASLIVFSKWLHPALGATEIARFLAIDAGVGLLAVVLIIFSAHRGPTGELILIALRLGQIPILHMLGINLFMHDIIDLVALAVVPAVILLILPMVFRLHLSGIMDLVCRWGEGGEGG